MRKFWGIAAIATVAMVVIPVFVARVPVTVVNGAVVRTPPAWGLDSASVFLVVLIVGVMALLGAWLRERHISREANSRNQLSASADERLARIEQSLEAVALEVERIGEMERFATKLLMARQTEMEARAPLPPSSPPRVITPH